MAEKKDKKEDKDSEVFVLKLNPENVCFANPKLGDEYTTTAMKLSNPTKEWYIFKVKCTSNDMFKIKAPVGILKPEETIDIGVVHVPGKAIPDNNKQYFAVYYVKTDSSVKSADVREEWKKKGKHDGVKRVFISFDKGGGENKKKDSEGGEKKEKTEEKEKKEKDTQEDKKDDTKKEDKKEEKKDEEEKK